MYYMSIRAISTRLLWIFGRASLYQRTNLQSRFACTGRSKDNLLRCVIRSTAVSTKLTVTVSNFQTKGPDRHCCECGALMQLGSCRLILICFNCTSLPISSKVTHTRLYWYLLYCTSNTPHQAWATGMQIGQQWND